MMNVDLSTVPVIKRDIKRERAYLDNLFVIASYPRSGSHWTRRMVGEITAIRSGMSAAFGEPLQHTAGFLPPYFNEDADKWETPFFVASHSLSQYPPSRIKVYLRRRFEDVLRSTRKAEAEMDGSEMKCWWGGTDDEVYEKWSKHVARGCVIADVVIDYEMTLSNPATTIRTIGRIAGMDLTEAEIAAAVLAGDRQNMLKEQEACENRQWDIVNREDKTNHPKENVL